MTCPQGREGKTACQANLLSLQRAIRRLVGTFIALYFSFIGIGVLDIDSITLLLLSSGAMCTPRRVEGRRRIACKTYTKTVRRGTEYSLSVTSTMIYDQAKIFSHIQNLFTSRLVIVLSVGPTSGS